MTCERCQLIEDEYVQVEAEGLTRDALMLAVAALRVEVAGQHGVIENRTRHMQAYAADALEERGVSARWRMRAEDMHRVIVDFCESVTAAAHHWEGPRGGQHVPYHGDWACAVPSVRQRLKWWARHLRDAAKEGEA
jgi:hypothetical protein